jgi:hypothetical protein
MSDKKNKKKVKYQLPSEDGIDVMELLDKIKLDKEEQENKVPPPFKLEIGIPANNIVKQLKKQGIEFDPSVIKKYDKIIKGIVDLSNENFISKKKSRKLIFAVYERAIKHVYFIYEML